MCRKRDQRLEKQQISSAKREARWYVSVKLLFYCSKKSSKHTFCLLYRMTPADPVIQFNSYWYFFPYR